MTLCLPPKSEVPIIPHSFTIRNSLALSLLGIFSPRDSNAGENLKESSAGTPSWRWKDSRGSVKVLLQKVKKKDGQNVKSFKDFWGKW
jgi:hypothetical protein